MCRATASEALWAGSNFAEGTQHRGTSLAALAPGHDTSHRSACIGSGGHHDDRSHYRANVHRATVCNHFISAGEAAYAISIGFKEFQLLDYGDRHLGADPAEVARSWATSPNIGIGDSTGPLNHGPRRALNSRALQRPVS